MMMGYVHRRLFNIAAMLSALVMLISLIGVIRTLYVDDFLSYAREASNLKGSRMIAGVYVESRFDSIEIGRYVGPGEVGWFYRRDPSITRRPGFGRVEWEKGIRRDGNPH